MHIENITSASYHRSGDRTIELTITDPIDNTSIVKRYESIRGGLSWPTASAPAYFCVVAQEFVVPQIMGNKKLAGTRVLLAEYESDSLSLRPFYEKIMDISTQFMCREFQVDMPEERFACGFINDFDFWARERNSNVCFDRAYDTDNFRLGISRIKGAVDNGELIIQDDSIVYGQLRSITREELKSFPEETFFAINGLRHVISSYCRQPPAIRHSQNNRLQKKMKGLYRTGSFMSS